MSTKKKTRILINPISGGKSKLGLAALINQYLDKTKFEFNIAYTESGEHAIALAQEAAQQEYDILVAAGGDGTLNQVASKLIHTQTAMGIIPLGSGNGFARALNIPMNTAAAINGLNQAQIKTIDTGLANAVPFINVCGFGFDAHVSAGFASHGKRGLQTYAKVSLQSIRNYQSKTYQLVQTEKTEAHTAFIFAICNGPQYGNNAYISPLAELNDGLFNLTIIEKVNWRNLLGLSINLFMGKLHESKRVKTQQIKDFTLVQPEAAYVNIDGEPIWFDKEVNISILPNSLRVLSK
ncbi:MAG: diacylglycerol kinase family lipid kinase [bacterium]|nr:diacylglycerol kinase family lipid kinase [bacterium]